MQNSCDLEETKFAKEFIVVFCVTFRVSINISKLAE